MTTFLAPADEKYSRHVVILAWRFVQRWDLYVRQLDDGRYACVHEPLSIELLLAHLRGEITLGAYILDAQSEARFMVVDADDEAGFDRLLDLSSSLDQNGVPSYLEKSRRGGHLWLFFASPVPGREAREFGLGVLAVHQVDSVELFPKQDELMDGPGSLIRMPFGVHRLSGKRYGFYTPQSQPLASSIREQIEALIEPQCVPTALFMAYRSNNPQKLSKAGMEKPGDYAEIAAQIKSKVRVLEFVGRYVDLRRIGSGAVGLCPFHDDHHPSFGVNDRENYWNCFAGCGGGTIIDFWMKWKGCDFPSAVSELAQMLL